MWTDEGHRILPCELYLSQCYFMLLTGMILKSLWCLDPAFSRTVMVGWPEPLCGESLRVNTVNHNHTSNRRDSSGTEERNEPIDASQWGDKDSNIMLSLIHNNDDSRPTHLCFWVCLSHVWVGVWHSNTREALEFKSYSQECGPFDLVHSLNESGLLALLDLLFYPKFFSVYSALN